MQQIITCTGYGQTGSSAATNIIEEFENVKSLDSSFECTFLHECDGLKDLENALKEGHRLKVDMAIKRFLRLVDTLDSQNGFQKYFNKNFAKYSKEFIDSISKVQWNGNWHRGTSTIKFSKEELFHYNLAKQIFLNEYSYSNYSLYEPYSWQPSYQIKTKSYYAFFDDSFYFKVQKYIDNLMEEISNHTAKKRILIDQFFPTYNIQEYLNYAPQTKIIIVDRDPRDMYVLNKSFWCEPYIPSDNADIFINWYKGIRFSQKQEIRNKNVILFYFEDFIFNYENSLRKLKQFLEFKDEEHTKKQQFFNPEKSIKNTYKFKNYPQWKDDILKIEKELSDYCYNFPNDCDNMIKVENREPIETYMKKADKIQSEKKLPAYYQKKITSLLFCMTQFGEAVKHFNSRKTPTAKIKGIIKMSFFLLIFPFEFIFMYIFYLKRTKNSL